MIYRFQKHYSVDEARTLIPSIRKWLSSLSQAKEEIDRCERRLHGLFAHGADLGGEIVNRWARTLAETREILVEFYEREIQIKDLDRGLVDFPAIIGGKEVFLCWEKCEDDIEFWHDLDTGYSGREHV